VNTLRATGDNLVRKTTAPMMARTLRDLSANESEPVYTGPDVQATR
jgi:hypothetical protein